jgi:hypothetical protein
VSFPVTCSSCLLLQLALNLHLDLVAVLDVLAMDLAPVDLLLLKIL